MDNEKWKEIVRKLMLKAEDLATTSAERETINERVMYLMAKYSIEQSMLNFDEKKPIKIISTKYQIQQPYIATKAIILNGISSVLGGKSIKTQTGLYHIFGDEDDLMRIFMLYHSIIIQMINSLQSAEKPANVHGKTFNLSFVNGFALEVNRRLKIAYSKAREDVRSTSSGVDLVISDKDAALGNAVREVYPHLLRVYNNVLVSNATGYNAGTSAGASADIGQTRVGRGSRAITR